MPRYPTMHNVAAASRTIARRRQYTWAGSRWCWGGLGGRYTGRARSIKHQSLTPSRGSDHDPRTVLRLVLGLFGASQRCHGQHETLDAVLVKAHHRARARALAVDAGHLAGTVAVVHDEVPDDEPEVLGAGGAHRRRGAGPEGATRGEVGVATQEAVFEVRGASRWARRRQVVDQFGGDLGEEPARYGRGVLAPQRAAPGVREDQVTHGARDADVAEPALLFELVVVAHGPTVREDGLFESGDHDRRILQALGDVQCHQRDRAGLAVELVGVGDERHALDEVEQRVVL